MAKAGTREPGSGSIWAEGSEPRFQWFFTPVRGKLPSGGCCSPPKVGKAREVPDVLLST